MYIQFLGAAGAVTELREWLRTFKKQPRKTEVLRRRRGASLWGRYLLELCLLVNLSTCPATAQQVSQTPDREKNAGSQKKQSEPAKLARLPIEWLIGPYIPVQGTLQPLTNEQRVDVYVRHTFLTAGSYLGRAFAAGIDQARGEPYLWGGGMSGYGKRYAARYGEFVIRNSLTAAGDAALGYEPRYDLCRCAGFWPRTRHAIARNFVAYNRTERELRPQVPLYAGSFAAGALYGSWLPGRHNMWTSGALSVAGQAGLGSAANFVREFALDILHKFGSRK